MDWFYKKMDSYMRRGASPSPSPPRRRAPVNRSPSPSPPRRKTPSPPRRSPTPPRRKTPSPPRRSPTPPRPRVNLRGPGARFSEWGTGGLRVDTEPRRPYVSPNFTNYYTPGAYGTSTRRGGATRSYNSSYSYVPPRRKTPSPPKRTPTPPRQKTPSPPKRSPPRRSSPPKRNTEPYWQNRLNTLISQGLTNKQAAAKLAANELGVTLNYTKKPKFLLIQFHPNKETNKTKKALKAIIFKVITKNRTPNWSENVTWSKN